MIVCLSKDVIFLLINIYEMHHLPNLRSFTDFEWITRVNLILGFVSAVNPTPPNSPSQLLLYFDLNQSVVYR